MLMVHAGRAYSSKHPKYVEEHFGTLVTFEDALWKQRWWMVPFVGDLRAAAASRLNFQASECGLLCQVGVLVVYLAPQCFERFFYKCVFSIEYGYG